MLSPIVNPLADGGRAGRLLPAVGGELVVAFGGDGTVGAVAGALKDTTAVLGVLPGGRGNDSARMIGLLRSPVAACATLASGEVSSVDLCQAGDKTSPKHELLRQLPRVFKGKRASGR